ncbi:hypothetical protein J7I97_25160 [Streptomyces sp. ISL-87]|uniref:hypothetical protein n=1 Tax=Streptomyces sp. ISL-87 TaxID=2819188 RepID=UPI001BEB6FD0|nr:hypothetical protein [Streptomyces sp. ISL-87]MBT2611457.1 hypothetical protein [Streptomyces sp. ISL-87]
MTTRRTRSSVHRRILAATASAAVLTVVLSGCTKEEKATLPPPSLSAPAAPTVSPSPSADPLAADKAEVQAASDRYWSVIAAAYSKADSKGTDLKKVATGSAYARIEGGLINLRNAGQVTVGSPQYSGTSISFKERAKLKTAVITGCTDVSKWKPVDKKTGEEIALPAERRLRYITTLTAEKWPDGWVILEEKIQDQAC